MAGHAHADGDKHDHRAGANARQLTIALVLTGTRPRRPGGQAPLCRPNTRVDPSLRIRTVV